MRSSTITGTILLAAAGTAFAQAHEGDIALTVESGRIVSGFVEGGSPTFPARLFQGEFGELPNWTNDPGFDSLSGTFEPAASLGFSVGGPLLAWDGSAFSAASEERLSITKARLELITPESGPAEGFVFGQASTTGRFHHHLGYELLAPASQGVYLLELTIWDDAGELGTSEPIFIVFGQDADPADVAAASQWVEDTLLGEPCAPDIDGDGELTIFDFLAFQNAFDAGEASADFDGDGALTIFDFLAFQNAFDAGC